MNELDKKLRKLDEEGKVGWNEEGFEKLDYDEKLAASVGNLIGQVYNGGLLQYYGNGYGFADEFLFQEVSAKLDVPNFRNWLDEAISADREYENLEPMQSAFDLEGTFDRLDRKFYDKIGEALEQVACEYLKEEN
jgi:hypothetical protein